MRQDEIWSHSGETSGGVSLEEEIEERKVGKVSWRVYQEYFRYGATPLFLFLVPVIFYSGEGKVNCIRVRTTTVQWATEIVLKLYREFTMQT